MNELLDLDDPAVRSMVLDKVTAVLEVMHEHGAFNLLTSREQAQVLVGLAVGVTPTCVQRCGPLRWADDAYVCPTCGDEGDLLHAFMTWVDAT